MKDYRVGSESRAPVSTVVRLATLSMDDLPPWLSETFTRVPVFLAAHGSYPDGPPFARYHQLGAGRFDVEAGFPVARPVQGRGDLHQSSLPGGLVATTTHTGSLAGLAPCRLAVSDWITAHEGRPVGDSWEVYFGDLRTSTESEAWRTEIVQPYRLGVPASSGV
jgi:effector-binding domain-containing protein